MTTTRTAAREMRATSTVLAFVLVVVGAAVAAEALSSPPEYFGGQDNEGYLSWISASPISEWTSATYMPSAADPDVGAAVHWFIDNSTGGTLELAVATKSTGWLAFGMSVAGGMLGADLFVVEAINLTEIKDMHVLSERLPVMDECQNWQLVNAQRSDDGFLLVRVRRAATTRSPSVASLRRGATKPATGTTERVGPIPGSGGTRRESRRPTCSRSTWKRRPTRATWWRHPTTA
jgi:DOMON domain